MGMGASVTVTGLEAPPGSAARLLHVVAQSQPSLSSSRIDDGNELIVTPPLLRCRAHEGVVLTLSWNGVTGRIATGGEDCRFRVSSTRVA